MVSPIIPIRNEVGLSLDEWQSLAPDAQQCLREKAYKKMQASGAHYVIDTVADLPAVLESIERRMHEGGMPH